MNMIFAFIVLFLSPIGLKEHISNIEHVLSKVFNMIHNKRQQKKRKENNMIKLNLCFA